MKTDEIYEDSDVEDFKGKIFTPTFFKLVAGVLLGLALSVLYVYLLLG
jgi:hypothetical protein